MRLEQYAKDARDVNGRFKQKVNAQALEVYMRSKWGKVTLQQVADHFEVSLITIKRYAKKFKLVRCRESNVLQLNQKLTAHGVLTVTGAVQRHELR